MAICAHTQPVRHNLEQKQHAQTKDDHGVLTQTMEMLTLAVQRDIAVAPTASDVSAKNAISSKESLSFEQ